MNQLQYDPQQLQKLCQQNDITYLGLFGSYARGDANLKSDVDLLVKFKTRKSLLDIIDIEYQFQDMFGKKVDLLTEGAISPYILERILSQMKTIYE